MLPDWDEPSRTGTAPRVKRNGDCPLHGELLLLRQVFWLPVWVSARHFTHGNSGGTAPVSHRFPLWPLQAAPKGSI